MIWCVEDDSSIRDIEVYALASTGFEARGFEDGNAFWDALQSEKPELVILDVMLPGITGVELLRKMKESEVLREIPVIMATAKGTEYDKIQSLDLSRVFERFYRVDKSHSKQSGGTGLGLSIVKHAAAYHKAQLRLESAQDAGTTITVAFPK